MWRIKEAESKIKENINTDKENESCSQKQEPRENKYRDLIKPPSDVTIYGKTGTGKTAEDSGSREACADG